MPTVSELWIYPLKAARGRSVTQADVEAMGLAGDRRWMVIDETNRFVTQRTHPRLALVQAVPRNGRLHVQAPGQPELAIETPSDTARRCDVRIWNDTVAAVPAFDAATAWISRYLEGPFRLVYLPDDAVRPVDPIYSFAGDRVSFADGYPLLVISRASLDGLNARLDVSLPMNRFRPNVVVDGTTPHAEDGWTRLRIGTVTFRGVKACQRCAVTTVDQETAVPGKEPLRTLGTYRKRERGVYFGQNLIPDGPGQIHVGDPVVILEGG